MIVRGRLYDAVKMYMVTTTPLVDINIENNFKTFLRNISVVSSNWICFDKS